MNQETSTPEVPEVKTSFARKDYSEEGVVTITFGNGESVVLDTNALTAEQQFNLLMHGAMQKIGDAYASAKGNYTFAIAAAQKVCDQLLADQWTASRASTGEGAPKVGELSQAIANLKQMDIKAVSEAVTKATDEQRKAWRKNAAISAEIARIRAEKAAVRAAKESTGGTVNDIVI